MEEPNHTSNRNPFLRCLDFFRTIGDKVEEIRIRLIRIPFFNFLDRVINDVGNDGAIEIVGAIAYYAFLSFFPLIIGVIAVLGFILPADEVQRSIFQFVETNIPGIEDLVIANIEGIVGNRTWLGIVSIVALFFPVGAMFSAISRGVNRAWGLNIRHHLIERKLREAATSVGICIFFFVVIISSSVLVAFNPGNALGGVGVRISFVFLVFVIFLIIYKTIPAIKTRWRHVWPGALFAAVAFEVARTIMITYFNRFARIELVQGIVGSILVLLIFIYYVSLILVLGAEISSEYSRMRLGLPPRRRIPPDLYLH